MNPFSWHRMLLRTWKSIKHHLGTIFLDSNDTFKYNQVLRLDRALRRFFLFCYEYFFRHDREFKIAVYFRLGELLFNLGLENIKFVLHIPIYVVKTLFGCVVVCLMPFFVCKGRNHGAVKLLYFASKIIFHWRVSSICFKKCRRRAFRTNFALI